MFASWRRFNTFKGTIHCVRTGEEKKERRLLDIPEGRVPGEFAVVRGESKALRSHRVQRSIPFRKAAKGGKKKAIWKEKHRRGERTSKIKVREG